MANRTDRWGDPINDGDDGGKKVKTFAKIGIGIVTGFIILVVISLLFGAFGFIMQKIDTNEVGLITKAGRPIEVVGPGVYTRWGPFSYYDMEQIDTSAINFCVEDAEVLTKADEDSNPIRLGVKVCGDLFRPSLTDIREMGDAAFFSTYIKYRPLYLSNDPVVGYMKGEVWIDGLVQAKGPQAMKGCIGQGDFFDAAVGTSRNDTADCHDEALNQLVRDYKFTVKNVTVPNIAIPDEVGNTLDRIAQAQFDTEAEKELADLAVAQAARQQAEQEGAIRVAQAETQERLRQNIQTAELERLSVDAQLDVIEAQKANDLKAAVLELKVVEAEALVAELEALVALAPEAALVALYADYPDYLEYLEALAYAAAWGELDKAIVPVGTEPKIVLSPDGDLTTVVSPE
jgi:hypothetical protein